MADTTINGLTATTSAVAADEIPIWVAGSAVTRKITRSNFLTGYGALATAGTWTALQTFSAGISLGNETLSTYDEGTFTPTLAFGGGSTGITYSVRSGQYMRIGQLVFFELRTLLSAKGSSTGAATITGLPFTVASSSTPALPVSTFLSALTASVVDVRAVLTSGGTAVSLYAATAAYTSIGVATDATFANNSQIYIAGCYRV